MSVILLSFLLAGPFPADLEPTPPAAVVQSQIRDISVGDPLRRVLLDTLREAVVDDLGQPVQFVVETLRVEDRDWAFYSGEVQQPNGREIDFSRTRYREAMQEGMFDGPITYALLNLKNGTWRVVAFVVGPTDVAYLGWADEYKAPAALFE